MIRSLVKDDIDTLVSKFDFDKDYLESLVGNMNEYMYISINSDDIDGFIICFNDGVNIIIKNIFYTSYNIMPFLSHLSFNANKDIVISTDDDELIKNLLMYDYKYDINSLTYKKKFQIIIPDNISYYEYFEQDETFKKFLLSQINEPLWGGAKYLYNKIITNDVRGKVYVIYDEDRNHIVSFASLSDYDEIDHTSFKPWIGCVYTFRPYRGSRYSEKLIKYILNECKNNGVKKVYLSSDHIGLYEKYGFVFKKMMKTTKGTDTQVFVYDFSTK